MSLLDIEQYIGKGLYLIHSYIDLKAAPYTVDGRRRLLTTDFAIDVSNSNLEDLEELNEATGTKPELMDSKWKKRQSVMLLIKHISNIIYHYINLCNIYQTDKQ